MTTYTHVDVTFSWIFEICFQVSDSDLDSIKPTRGLDMGLVVERFCMPASICGCFGFVKLSGK